MIGNENSFIYWIDILGSCNLRCPSCPVANTSHPEKYSGLMSLELFGKIIRKAVSETFVSAIAMYNWSEPFLHPELPKFIRVVNSHGLTSMLSTNLNKINNLSEIVKAKPTEIRISLSGFYQETYSVTHKKGNIETVKENMHILREEMDRQNSNIHVEIGYHKYLHNLGEEYNKMKELCNELRFVFKPAWANFSPLEKMITYFEDKSKLPEEDLKLIDLLVLKPEDSVKLAEQFKDYDCFLRSGQTAINADGSVALCCATFEQQNNIAPNFLDLSHEELQKRKYENPLCSKCMSKSLHMLYANPASNIINKMEIL